MVFTNFHCAEKETNASGKKKNWRIIVDYCKLNKKTSTIDILSDRSPNLLDKLGCCQYFTTLDLASGFHQVEMALEEMQKRHSVSTTDIMSIYSCPLMMDDTFTGIQNECCLTYMDDVIFFGTQLQ